VGREGGGTFDGWILLGVWKGMVDCWIGVQRRRSIAN